MAYDKTIPDEANTVRTASGDLIKMRDNFVELEPAGTSFDGSGNLVMSGVVSITSGAVGAPGLALVGDAQTGFYSPVANQLAVTVGGVFQAMFAAAGALIKSGDAATPSLAGSSFSTTGLYWASSLLGFAVDAVARMNLTPNYLTLTTASGLKLPNGTAAVPSVSFGDDDAGMYRPAANQIGVAVEGAQILKVTSGGLEVFSGTTTSGLEALPGLHFGDVDTGWYRSASGEIALASTGTETLRYSSIGVCHARIQPRTHITVTSGIVSGSTDILSGVITFDTQIYDRGLYADPVDDKLIILSDFEGTYRTILEVEFVESTSTGTPNSGVSRTIALEYEGEVRGRQRIAPLATGDNYLVTQVEGDLLATDTIKAMVQQDSGGTMKFNAQLTTFKMA
jgi:hypothetical protein